MGEQHRLRALQVGVAGHRRLEMLLGAGQQRRLDLDPPRRLVEDLAEVEPLVERDLIVPGAAGVELAADRPRHLDEPPLDVQVDVLELPPEREGAALELGRTPSSPASRRSSSASVRRRARASARAHARLPSMS